MAKPCKFCGSTMHTSLMCYQRPRIALKSRRKTMNRIGPVAAKWIETRHEWIQQNATPTGTWKCTYCPRTLGVEADPDDNIWLLTLDHKLSRSRHPELRYVLSNLTPSCYPCNTEKGSKDIEEFIQWHRPELAQ